jgi:nucleoside-diphosphate-sugar epimerase
VSQLLVTGGTGTLGRVIVHELTATSRSVRVLSRRPRTNDTSGADWVVGDLRSGLGVDDSVAGIDTIVHCASGRGDAVSAKNLVRAGTGMTGSRASEVSARVIRVWNCVVRKIVYGSPQSSMTRSAARFDR